MVHIKKILKKKRKCLSFLVMATFKQKMTITVIITYLLSSRIRAPGPGLPAGAFPTRRDNV